MLEHMRQQTEMRGAAIEAAIGPIFAKPEWPRLTIRHFLRISVDYNSLSVGAR